MLKKFLLMASCGLMAMTAADAHARNQVRAVGSSTVYPFVTVAAEEFGAKTGFKTPIIESTGTGGGFKLFCAGVGNAFPDLSNASRAIEPSEKQLCAKNGVKNITEIKVGFDGIVFANSIKAPRLKLTKDQIFMALAREVPKNGKLVPNPYKMWSEIAPNLPNAKIEVYGPPPTSGTRDAFVELVMEKACADKPEFKKAYADAAKRKKQCHLIREDGHYIESGENDNIIIQKLTNNYNAIGISGFSYLEQNRENIQGAAVEGIEPTFETITAHAYPVSRPLYVYLKNEHLGIVEGLAEFAKELVSERAIGEEGYLTYRGLIPLPKPERAEMSKKVIDSVTKAG